MKGLFLIAGGALELIMRLIGASAPESVSEDEYERYSHYLEHPLEINLLSGDKILESGLLTAYQTASFVDYRDRHGDVLSFSELACVDGFPEETVKCLAPFITLDSYALPGSTSAGKRLVSNELVTRGGFKAVGGAPTYSYGMKYRFSSGDVYDAGLTFSRGHADKVHWPVAQSFFFAFNGRRHLAKLVVGDHNLKFGQGLALWTGFMMSGVGAPSSLFRRPSGVSPYWSWSGEGSRRGVAADMRFGPLSVSASLAMNGLRELINGEKDVQLAIMPSLNVGWSWRNLQTSLTCTATTVGLESLAGDGGREVFRDMKVSGDFSCCVRGVDLFGEIALDVLPMEPMAVAGSRLRCCEALTAGVRARYLPDAHSVAVSGEFKAGSRVWIKGADGFGSSEMRHCGVFSIDAGCFPQMKPSGSWQVKGVFDYACRISPSFVLDLRIVERFGSRAGAWTRTDVRADLKYSDGTWEAVSRMNVLYGAGLSAVVYAEGGYRGGMLSAHLRAGAFKVDDWNDRIYVYERDAPGNFNVPACYGRGYWVSCYAGLRSAGKFKAYLRASFTGYPWMPEGKEKPGRAELKLQLVFSI